MKLELGINTCFAVKRWPLPREWAAIVRDRLELSLVELSFDTVDTSAESIAAESAAVKAAAAEFGLAVNSTFTGLAAYSSNMLLSPDGSARESAAGWFRRAIDFSGNIGAAATGGHVGAFSVTEWAEPKLRAQRWDGLRAALHDLAAHAHDRGLRALLVENLAAAREPSTIAMIRELLTDSDESHAAVRLALDVGHMCVTGTGGDDRDPYAWLRQLGASAFEVQLQQSDTEGDHHWPFTPEANRRGRIGADWVIDALGDSGVEEMALVLEVIPPFEQDDDSVIDDLVASVDYWREALVRRGVA
jgi:D-erythrulose 1-phosphate 3-epimerase